MLFKSKIGLIRYLKYSWYVIALVIFGISFFPTVVEAIYTRGFFKNMSQGLRFVSGKFETAIGEFVFFMIINALIINTIQYFVKNKDEYKNASFWKSTAFKFIHVLIKLYVVFELIWGLNYLKPSPAAAFNLAVPVSYSKAEVAILSLELIKELNHTRQILPDSAILILQPNAIFEANVLEYQKITVQYPFLKYAFPCIKTAQFSKLGDYLGYLAFYQPITGEAIVRGDLPILTLPFTVSHEIAHQLGYASETEANFIAFVIGSESKDPLFRYSMLLQLFSYVQIAHLDLVAAKGNFKEWEAIVTRNKQLLSPKVLADRKKIKAFFAARSALLIPVSVTLYDQFLQLNKQAKGIDSYNDVILWALAYRKKHLTFTN